MLSACIGGSSDDFTSASALEWRASGLEGSVPAAQTVGIKAATVKVKKPTNALIVSCATGSMRSLRKAHLSHRFLAYQAATAAIAAAAARPPARVPYMRASHS